MIDFENKSVFKLKQIPSYADKVAPLLLDGEEVLDSYKSMRDGVVFTSSTLSRSMCRALSAARRMSPPYKNIVAYSIETSGTFDIDSELELYFSSLGRVHFEFSGKSRIMDIAYYIARYAL